MNKQKLNEQDLSNMAGGAIQGTYTDGSEFTLSATEDGNYMLTEGDTQTVMSRQEVMDRYGVGGGGKINEFRFSLIDPKIKSERTYSEIRDKASGVYEQGYRPID